MAERLTPQQVVDEAEGVLVEWFNGGYCWPLGDDGPQFKVVLQDDGTYLVRPAFPYNEAWRVHPDDADGVVFRLTVTAERILEP